MMLMMDAYQPEGVTTLAVDSIFMMPHLGVLAQVNEKAALDVFYKDCLVPLGTCVAAVGQGKEGERCFDFEFTPENGASQSGSMNCGDILHIPFEGNGKIVCKPAKKFNLGAGPGAVLEAKIEGGMVGLILDARGRPLLLPKDDAKRIEMLTKWQKAIEMYPECKFC